jgi:hypothetical protein
MVQEFGNLSGSEKKFYHEALFNENSNVSIKHYRCNKERTL